MQDGLTMFIRGVLIDTPVSVPFHEVRRIELMENGKAAIIVKDARITTELTVEDVEFIIEQRINNNSNQEHLGTLKP